MNIVFAGTPHFAIPCLEALIHSEHQITAIYTQPDRPAGRGHKLQPSPVKTWANLHNLPLYQPLNFKNTANIEELRGLKPDIMIVIAYGLILPQAVLNIPLHGCINVHASLLPRWRGASPIQQSILHGDHESGVTLMQLDAGMDTGPVFTKVHCPITLHETAGSLHDKLALLSAPALIEVLNAIDTGIAVSTPQNLEGVTHASKISKDDARIDWKNSATEIDCQIRAFNPWPIAFTYVNEETLRIHQARVLEFENKAQPGTIVDITKEGLQIATGKQILLIERIQFAGGKVINIADYLNASRQLLHINQVLA